MLKMSKSLKNFITVREMLEQDVGDEEGEGAASAHNMDSFSQHMSNVLEYLKLKAPTVIHH